MYIQNVMFGSYLIDTNFTLKQDKKKLNKVHQNWMIKN
jgi:hypothetical protein